VTGTNAVISGTNLSIANGSLPTTWTKYTFTSTVPASTKNLTLRFASVSLGSTASADTVWYEIAEVQLERGAAATDFERRPIGVELQLCKRYYQELCHIPGLGYSSTQVTAFCPLPIEMRVAPTISATGTLNYQGDGTQNATQSSISFSGASSQRDALYVTAANFSSITVGRTLALAIPANNGNKMTLSAEL
jgi:hypothetical protein